MQEIQHIHPAPQPPLTSAPHLCLLPLLFTLALILPPFPQPPPAPHLQFLVRGVGVENGARPLIGFARFAQRLVALRAAGAHEWERQVHACGSARACASAQAHVLHGGRVPHGAHVSCEGCARVSAQAHASGIRLHAVLNLKHRAALLMAGLGHPHCAHKCTHTCVRTKNTHTTLWN